MQDFEAYMKEALPETVALLKELCLIPAPSHHEERRAEFCKNWLEAAGAEGVYIDEALNVIYPMNCEGKDDIVVFCAHTDTVFPEETPLLWREDEENYYCPAVGDDTCCLVQMMMAVKYILSRGIQPKTGVLFVCNSCEEGLGNLKGTRQIFKDFAGRIKCFYTFDGGYRKVTNRCVGSHRYRVECRTEGGHSFGAFGNRNAITALAALITDLTTVEVPQKEGCKTTYNVGTISGGTSVNTIAQYAEMLCEYRSDDAACLADMKRQFEERFATAIAAGKGDFTVTLVGERPCGGEIDRALHAQMTARVQELSQKHSGQLCHANSGSTDCNIPMSLGVPAVCVGTHLGGGAHTREERVQKDSVLPGLLIVTELILDYFN